MISIEELDEIIKCGTFALSETNRHSFIIIAVTNKEIWDRFSKLNAKILVDLGVDPFFGASVVLVVLADKKYLFSLYNDSLVMCNLINAAYSFGIGSCLVHKTKEVLEIDEGKSILNDLGITVDYEGIGNCILVYPLSLNKETSKRKDDYVYFIK